MALDLNTAMAQISGFVLFVNDFRCSLVAIAGVLICARVKQRSQIDIAKYQFILPDAKSADMKKLSLFTMWCWIHITTSFKAAQILRKAINTREDRNLSPPALIPQFCCHMCKTESLMVG